VQRKRKKEKSEVAGISRILSRLACGFPARREPRAEQSGTHSKKRAAPKVGAAPRKKI